MQQYIGQECPICHKQFVKEDDVVVCPECGTPHHRACYKSLGECANTAKHEEDFVWKLPPTAKPPAQEKEQHKCVKCGMLLPQGVNICASCGTPIAGNPVRNTYRQQEVMSPQGAELPRGLDRMEISSIEGIPLKDIIIFVGNNPLYFVNIFKVLSTHVRNININLAAMLFGALYFFYRKMYKPALALLCVNFLCWIPTFMMLYHIYPQILADPTLAQTFQYDLTGLDGILMLLQVAQAVSFGLSIFCGLAANKCYLNHTINTIRQIQMSFGDKVNTPEYSNAIAYRGRTSLAMAFTMVAVLAVGFFVAISIVFVMIG